MNGGVKMPLSLIQIRKKEIRHEMRLRKKNVTEVEREIIGKEIFEKLVSMKEFKEAKSISIYVAYNQEIPTIPIIEEAFRQGKEVASPIVEEGEIEFYRYHSLEELEESKYGILEPTKKLGVVSDNSLVIMPGVAFDESRNRIGYGGGYYDRYLTRNSHLKTIAIAYDFQVYEQFEGDKGDYKPDKILTEKRLIE